MLMDFSVIGIVFAIILFIIFFAAIVLYLSFRIKETFKEEKKRGMLAVKVGFLIGILFLAGGSFYFFAQVLTSSSQPVPENSTDITPQPEIPDDEIPEAPSNETVNGKPELNLLVSYPSNIRMNTELTMTFSITNPTEYVAHGVVIQTNSLFEYFNLSSSTHQVTGNAIEIDEVSSGTTISSLNLLSSNRPSELRETITLIFSEMTQQITQEISISISGGPG